MAWHDQPKHRDHPDVDAYIADLDDAQRALCSEIRDRLKQDPDVVEGIAWGVPCYFRNGPLAYTSVAKKHITMGWFRGIEISDPSGRLAGTGKSPVAKAVLKLTEPLPESFDDWLGQALKLDDAGD